jgi:voltage-gated potassium channel
MRLNPSRLNNVKHELMLLSLIVLLFGQLFIPQTYHELTRPFFFAQSVFAGIVLFSEWRLWRNIFITLFFIIIFMEIYGFYYDNAALNSISGIIYIFFFLAVSLETYRQIYSAKDVQPAMISAVFSGFILLCLMTSLFFLIIEIQSPESFSGIGTKEENYQNLTYFSFITTLTIGYGDIVPLTFQAKKAVMLIALLGNFYTVIVTGIIIGKYLNQKSK